MRDKSKSGAIVAPFTGGVSAVLWSQNVYFALTSLHSHGKPPRAYYPDSSSSFFPM